MLLPYLLLRVNRVYSTSHWGWAWPCDFLWPTQSGLTWGCACSEPKSQEAEWIPLSLSPRHLAMRTTWPKVALQKGGSPLNPTGGLESSPADLQPHRAALAYHRPMKQKRNACCFVTQFWWYAAILQQQLGNTPALITHYIILWTILHATMLGSGSLWWLFLPLFRTMCSA